MVIDKSDVFLEKMAKVVLDAQWAYPGNQMKLRTKDLSKEDTMRLLEAMDRQEHKPK
ncbi:hypothetical protein [Xanthomonas phage DES1]|nr:hypothetical protein [Xanthomonas phage DES1]